MKHVFVLPVCSFVSASQAGWRKKQFIWKLIIISSFGACAWILMSASHLLFPFESVARLMTKSRSVTRRGGAAAAAKQVARANTVLRKCTRSLSTRNPKCRLSHAWFYRITALSDRLLQPIGNFKLLLKPEGFWAGQVQSKCLTLVGFLVCFL